MNPIDVQQGKDFLGYEYYRLVPHEESRGELGENRKALIALPKFRRRFLFTSIFSVILILVATAGRFDAIPGVLPWVLLASLVWVLVVARLIWSEKVQIEVLNELHHLKQGYPLVLPVYVMTFVKDQYDVIAFWPFWTLLLLVIDTPFHYLAGPFGLLMVGRAIYSVTRGNLGTSMRLKKVEAIANALESRKRPVDLEPADQNA